MKFEVIGNIGKIDQFHNRTVFSIAENEKYLKDGVEHEKTDWYNITLWEVDNYFSVGDRVKVEGKITTSKKDDKYYTNYNAWLIALIPKREKIGIVDKSKPIKDDMEVPF